MSPDKSISVGISTGGDCVICNMPIQQATKILEVKVTVTVGYIPFKRRVEAHLHCGKEVRDLIDQKLAEAKK